MIKKRKRQKTEYKWRKRETGSVRTKPEDKKERKNPLMNEQGVVQKLRDDEKIKGYLGYNWINAERDQKEN